MISWKYTFKRLNEEYEIATKKKQALDNLCATGKISQETRDSFTGDIVKAIADIESQRKELGEKMQIKTCELESQLKTLEMLLANYEIGHVVGEIDDDIYGREISLLSNTLQNTRTEIDTLKQATNQLFSAPKAETPAVAEMPAAPVAQAPVESAPVEVPVETATIQPEIVETVTADSTTSVETAPIEAAPAPAAIEAETVVAEVAIAEAAAPVAEAAPVEAPIEAPVQRQRPYEVAPVVEAPARS